MCIQDIKIARAADAESVVTGASFSTTTVVMRANPNRFSLSGFVRINSIAVAGNVNGVFYALFGGTLFPLISFSDAQPGGNVNLQDVGQAITGPIVVMSYGSVTPDAWFVGESSFNAPVEELV